MPLRVWDRAGSNIADKTGPFTSVKVQLSDLGLLNGFDAPISMWNVPGLCFRGFEGKVWTWTSKGDSYLRLAKVICTFRFPV